MAANIEFNSNRNTYSFYSLKDVPWHGLGTVVEEAKTPDEIIRIANMDYEVALAPMFASFIPAEAKYIIKEDNLNKFDSITQGNSFKLGQTAFNKLVQRLSA